MNLKTDTKIDGVKDVFKWLDKKCKKQKAILDKEKEKQKNGAYRWHDDLGARYIHEEEVKLDTLVDIKISVEKYMRKLKHEERENKQNELM